MVPFGKLICFCYRKVCCFTLNKFWLSVKDINTIIIAATITTETAVRKVKRKAKGTTTTIAWTFRTIVGTIAIDAIEKLYRTKILINGCCITNAAATTAAARPITKFKWLFFNCHNLKKKLEKLGGNAWFILSLLAITAL